MAEFAEIIPGTIPTKMLHQHLLSAVAPRPIAFASTINKEGTPNLAPFSFFNVFSAKPPILIFSPARRVRNNTTKHTLGNVYEVPEVVVNIVDYATVEQMNLASCEYEDGVNEFEKAGLTMLKSDVVSPFRVAESPVQMECKVVEIKPLATEGGAGQLIFAEVVKMHINKEVLGEDGLIDVQKIDLVSRMGKNFYCRASGDAVFEVQKPGTTVGMGIDALPEQIRNSEILTGNDLGKLAMRPKVPTDAEIKAFRKEEANGLLMGLSNRDQLHEAAQAILGTDDIKTAWLMLMSRDF